MTKDKLSVSRTPLKYGAVFKNKRLEEIKNEAKNRGGECLSTEYVNNFTNLKFRCGDGHEWETEWKSIMEKNTWCPICHESSFITIEEIKKVAEERGGKCLNDKKNGSNAMMRWQCRYGHEWDASYGNVIGRNSWCPICSSKYSERICRYYFEAIFNKKFPTSYPLWLKNDNGNQLQLDGFCEELKIAFEHQGEHHYNKNNKYYSKRNENNDNQKRKLCRENGIYLIEIPALGYKTLEHIDIREIIKDYCLANNILIPKLEAFVDVKGAFINRENEERIIDANEIAKRNGGICLSTECLGSKYQMEFECANGHRWKATHNKVKHHWCGACKLQSVIMGKTNSLESAIALAQSKGGECLSKEYKNNHTKLLWRCSAGHKWFSTYNLIQRPNSWCPICGISQRAKKRKLGIEVFQEIARLKCGELLSTSYNNCYDKLTWKCANGHVWDARADQIKNTKRWCPICSKNRSTKCVIS